MLVSTNYHKNLELKWSDEKNKNWITHEKNAFPEALKLAACNKLFLSFSLYLIAGLR